MQTFRKFFTSAFALIFFLEGVLGAPLSNTCPTLVNTQLNRVIRLECLVTLIYNKVFDDTTGYDILDAKVTTKATELTALSGAFDTLKG